MRNQLLTILLLFAGNLQAAESGRVLTIGPGGDGGYTALHESSLQRAIEELRETGGRIVVNPGEYKLVAGISLSRWTSKLEIEGNPGARLVLAPAPCTELTASAAVGEATIKVASTTGLAIGQFVEFMDESGQLVNAKVTSLDGTDSLTISPALKTAMSAGTPVMLTVNGVLIYSSANITLSHLEIDMQREKQPYAPRNHSRHCAIMIAGPYQHGKGPLQTSSRVRVHGCILRNAWGRGVAFYASKDCEVIGCTVDNVHEEGINIDHYCRNMVVSQNRVSRVDKAAIELNDATDCSISGNEISDSTIGMKIWHYPPVATMDRHNQGNMFVDNSVAHCTTNAFWMGREVTHNVLAHNKFVNSGAVQLLGDNNLIIDSGKVSDDGRANIEHRGKAEFSFGVVADVQGGGHETRIGRRYREAAGKLEMAVADYNSRDLSFVLDLGDITDRAVPADFAPIQAAYARLKAPFHLVAGNHGHEYSRNLIEKLHHAQEGYYTFSPKPGWRFVMLNGQDAGYGVLGPAQLDWFRSELAAAKAAKDRVVVCSHFAVTQDSARYHLMKAPEPVIEAEEKSGVVVAHLAGHDHKGGYVELNGIHHLTLQGMVEAPLAGNGYGRIEVYKGFMLLCGVGTVPSRRMSF